MVFEEQDSNKGFYGLLLWCDGLYPEEFRKRDYGDIPRVC